MRRARSRPHLSPLKLAFGLAVPAIEVSDRARVDLETLERRIERLEKLRGLPQVRVLQAAFPGLAVTAERWPHFTSPEEMNSSITDWAPLTKSPNCASQATRALTFSTE